MSDTAHSPADRRIARILFAGLWAIYALIGPGASAVNPNVISRLGFVFAVLEDGTPRIDRFASFTVDKAEFEGHTYLDKAPGLSLMTLPVVAAVRAVALVAGGDGAPLRDGALTPFFWLCAFIAVALVVAPVTAAAAAILYLLARRLGASTAAALFAAVAFALATPAFGWSTTFFSHAVTGGLLFAGFAAVVRASTPGTCKPVAGAAVAGGLLGWAVVVEFTAAAPAAAIALAGLWRLRALPTRRAGVLLAATGAGMLAAVPLILYNLWCFGTPIHLAYSNVVGFDGMQSGLFGISLPRPEIAFALLFGLKRGLFWITPLLLLLPLAWRAGFRSWPGPIASISLVVPVLLFLINAGYAYWDGGASTGPRHLIPALPFAALALAPLWDASGPRLRRTLLALAGLSFALCLACAAVTMVAPMEVDTPLTTYLWPRLMSGEVHTVFMLIGITGFAPYIVPAMVLWVMVRKVAVYAGHHR